MLVPALGAATATRKATVTSVHDTVAYAYAKLDAIAAKLQRDGAPPDYLELYVVDADRHSIRNGGQPQKCDWPPVLIGRDDWI